jgi:thioredoxin-like negative regulator of GroEL
MAAEAKAKLAALFGGGGPRLPGGPPGFALPGPRAQAPPAAPAVKDEAETPQELQAAIERSTTDRLVIVVFVTSFAPPCVTVVKDLLKMKPSLSNLEVVTVDTASAKGLALGDAAGIEATPTLRFFVKGKQVHTMTTTSQDLIHPFVVKWAKKAQAAPKAAGHAV